MAHAPSSPMPLSCSCRSLTPQPSESARARWIPPSSPSSFFWSRSVARWGRVSSPRASASAHSPVSRFCERLSSTRPHRQLATSDGGSRSGARCAGGVESMSAAARALTPLSPRLLSDTSSTRKRAELAATGASASAPSAPREFWGSDSSQIAQPSSDSGAARRAAPSGPRLLPPRRRICNVGLRRRASARATTASADAAGA